MVATAKKLLVMTDSKTPPRGNTLNSRQTSELLWPFECRTCHERDVVLATGIQDPNSFHLVRRCARCGYLNVVERSTITLPLEQSVRSLPDESQADVLRSVFADHSAVSLRPALPAFITELDRLITRNPIGAQAALILAMQERERALAPALEDGVGTADPAADLHAKVVSRVTDVLYLLLHCRAQARLVDDPAVVHDRGRPFLREFFAFASDAVGIALHATGVEAGLWTLAVRDGAVVTEKTDMHSRLTEWDLNRREFERVFGSMGTEPSVDEAFTRETLGAQKLVLGFDSSNLIELCQGNFDLLRSAGALKEIHEVVRAIDITHLTEPHHRVLDSMALTLPRARRFFKPFYFDLGSDRIEPVADLEALVDVLGANWGNYYPFYRLEGDRTGAWMVTTKTPLLISLANLATFRNHLFRKLVESGAAGDLSRETRQKLAQLDKGLSKRLEDAAGDAARRAGWGVRLRLKKWRGQKLPCGEIDLLAGKRIGDVAVVVLAEIKDFDLTVTTRRDLAHLQERIQEAFSQLAVRVKWVANAWTEGLGKELLPDVGALAGELLPIVLTARYMPPFLFDRFLTVPFSGFAEFLERLSTEAFSTYRAVAGRTIVRLVGGPSGSDTTI